MKKGIGFWEDEVLPVLLQEASLVVLVVRVSVDWLGYSPSEHTWVSMSARSVLGFQGLRVCVCVLGFLRFSACRLAGCNIFCEYIAFSRFGVHLCVLCVSVRFIVICCCLATFFSSSVQVPREPASFYAYARIFATPSDPTVSSFFLPDIP